jgi:hypothetical protein
MPSRLVIGIIIAVVVVGLALGLGLGLGLKKDDSKEGSAAVPATATPAKTPKQTLLESGQAIQVAEVDISTAPPAFTAPTGIDTTKVSYSMSMDVQIAQAGPSWRNIMNNGDPDWPPGTTARRPAVFITGTDAAPANRIHIVHGSTEDQNKNIVTSFAATPGTYFNLTWVVDGGKLTTYINGQKDSAGSVNGTFTWGTANAWKWNAYKTQYPTRPQNVAGSVNVKNAYWFNKALTDADVTTLITASTTSTYAPEPYSLF